MAIGLSHGGTTIYQSSKSEEVLVGTAKGVVRIERTGGSEWRIAGQTLTDKHISAIVTEPVSGTIFAGAFHGGIHASTDGGRTWERRDNGVAEDDVYSMATVQLNGGPRVYAGTEPARLFYSDDLGMSWTELPNVRKVPSVDSWSFPGPPHIGHLKHINFDPDDPMTMYASVEVGALLKSIDAGETWTELTNGLYEDVHRTVINPKNGKQIYVSGGMGLWMTTDGGQNWEQITTREHEVGGYPDGLVLLPRQPELMFITSAHKSPNAWRESHFAGARISRSRDGGRTWEVLHNGLPDRLQASVEAFALEDHGDSFSLFAATTAGEVYASDDNGDHWAQIVSGLAPISKSGHYRALVTA